MLDVIRIIDITSESTLSYLLNSFLERGDCVFDLVGSSRRDLENKKLDIIQQSRKLNPCAFQPC